MVFSSAIFLFCFLPAVFLLDRLLRGVRLKNLLLLIASLIFYSFGQPVYLPLLLISVLLNYLCGLLAAGKHAKLGVALAVAGGIGMMAVFKYADFALGTVNSLFGASLPLPGITLPIGISFFTFQGLSLLHICEGYFKKITPQSWRMSQEHKLKEGDEVIWQTETTNKAEIIFFTNMQQAYKAHLYDFDDCKASVPVSYTHLDVYKRQVSRWA